jgi:hypothetical protein
MRNANLTERQWWQRAKRHEKWLTAMGRELELIGARFDRRENAQELTDCAARARAIGVRVARLQRVMQRHATRAPPERAGWTTRSLDMLPN